MALELLFSIKESKVIHPSLIFNGKDVSRSESHTGKFSIIINNGIALLRKLRHSIPRKPLLSIYKTFLRPHLDYCGVTYDKSLNQKFTDTDKFTDSV